MGKPGKIVQFGLCDQDYRCSYGCVCCLQVSVIKHGSINSDTAAVLAHKLCKFLILLFFFPVYAVFVDQY